MLTRTLLWIGEEGSVLYQYKNKKQILRYFLKEPQALKPFVHPASIEILIDTLPIRFVREMLPKSPLFDRRKILKHHLETVFYPERLWGGRALANSSCYGLCIPESPILAHWMKILKEEEWILKKIVSVAAESACLFPQTQLVVSLTEKGNSRQSFFHQGYALFTRYHKISSEEDQKTLIDNEVAATLVYLERQFMLPSKAISVSYFPAITEEDLIQNYLKSRPVLPLLPQEFKRSWAQFFFLKTLISIKLVLGVWMIGFFVFCTYSLYDLKKERTGLQNHLTSLQHIVSKYQNTPNFSKEKKLYTLIMLYKNLLPHQKNALTLLKKIHSQVSEEMRVTSFTWEEKEDALTLHLDFPTKNMNPEETYKKFLTFLMSLKEVFPNFQVQAVSSPYHLGDNQTLTNTKTQDSGGVIKIWKPVS